MGAVYAATNTFSKQQESLLDGRALRVLVQFRERAQDAKRPIARK
jgi:hypothetical protein